MVEKCYQKLPDLVETGRLSRDTEQVVLEGSDAMMTVFQSRVGHQNSQEKTLGEELAMLETRSKTGELSDQAFEKTKKEILDKITPLTVHTHMKNGTTEKKMERRKVGEVKLTPLPAGDINLLEVIRRLQARGYDGAISIEDEFEERKVLPLEEIIKVIKKDVEYLRSAM